MNEGYKSVPIEPTEQMIAAGVEGSDSYGTTMGDARECYRAMLSAAPPAPESAQPVSGKWTLPDVGVTPHIPHIPLYQSCKRVHACKIGSIVCGQYPGAILEPMDGAIQPFPISEDYLNKHQPEAGGYFVQYENGHQGFSPAKAFEAGYQIVLPLTLDEAVAAGRVPVNQPISQATAQSLRQQATAQSLRQQATAQSIRQQPDPPPYRKFDPDDRLVEGFPTKRYD